ncbi:hypothetical protein K7X08_030890 [Anisodus acutangulus]|uniref:Uncharacterized protein n=1 Tax=Anisodus acutangulus TaxID=402998 RepID=A0A9Q1RB93_9SOLA|nr:hypothetical protein K7X08_030890 [Anisodus acutangulus]
MGNVISESNGIVYQCILKYIQGILCFSQVNASSTLLLLSCKNQSIIPSPWLRIMELQLDLRASMLQC